MKKTSGPIVFFGNERLATGVTTTAPTLRRLIEAGFNIVAVVANNRGTRSRTKRDLEVAAVAHEYDIPILLPDKLSDITATIQNYKPVAGVLVAYGKIVPESIINLFPRGIINIHPSLLPLHRGPTPIESVILQGSSETGVSLMRLVKAMDAGPVYAQQTLFITGTESKQMLADELLKLGGAMLERHLPAILSGSLLPTPQDEARATYDAILSKNQGIINWHKSAQQLEREIRAFAVWPRSRTMVGGKEIIITEASVVISSMQPETKPGDFTVVEETGTIIVTTSNGSLEIKKVKPAGKREMSAREFLAGYKVT